MLGCQPSTFTQRSMHHQKSSSDSPFQANTENPAKGTTARVSEQQNYTRRGKRTRVRSTLTSLCQGSCHLILGRIDVTGSPPALSTQCRQSLHQHLFPHANAQNIQGLQISVLAICVQTCDYRYWQLTAVWAVMWVQPTTLAPARGFSPWALFLRAMRAGISIEQQTQYRLWE